MKKYELSTQSSQQQTSPNIGYEQIFKGNDQDNEKNKQMKKLRSEMCTSLEKDQAYKVKYEGQKIYMLSEFLDKVDN